MSRRSPVPPTTAAPAVPQNGTYPESSLSPSTGDGPGVSMMEYDNTAGVGVTPEGEWEGVRAAAGLGHSPLMPSAPPPAQTTPQPAVHLTPNAPPPDAWRDWMHPPADDKGHSSKVSLKVQPMIARQCEIAVGSKYFPYRSISDLVRHAIHRHLTWLMAFNNRVPSIMAQADAILEIIRNDEIIQDQQTVLAKMQSLVENHLAMGDLVSAQRVCTSALATIDSMPVGVWRDNYRANFMHLFGFAVGAVPAIGAGAGAGARQLPPSPSSDATYTGGGI